MIPAQGFAVPTGMPQPDFAAMIPVPVVMAPEGAVPPPAGGPGGGGGEASGGGGGGGASGASSRQQQQAAAAASPDSLAVAVLVPSDSIARVIGKAGQGLKQIRESSGVKLVVQEADADRGNGDARRVDIIGAALGVGAAAGQVLQAMSGQQFGSIDASIMIPNRCTGLVIGKGGEKLKLVRESTGVRIQVERDPVTSPLTGEEERLLSAQGEPANIGTALGIALGGGRLAMGFQRPGLPGGGAVVRGPGGGGCYGGVGPMGGPVVPSTTVGMVAGGMGGCGAGLVGGCGAGGGMLMGQNLGISPGEVHSMPDDPEMVQVHMVIPGKLTGAIVGKQGAAIQHLSAQSGCHRLSVTNRTGSADRRVICIGGLAQVQTAQQLVHNAAMMACESAGVDANTLLQVKVVFWIPKELSGAVIGKQGATLGAIREKASVRVQFGKEDIKEMRPCTIVGTLQNVMQAETMIYNLVAQEQQQRPPRPPSAGGGSGQDSSSDKRFRAEEQTKLLVPARCAGAIIGRQGMGLARLREDYAIKVEMLTQAQAPHFVEDRLLVIQGPSANRHNASVAILQQTLSQDQMQGVLKMLVSHQEAGAIIGKQGATLRQMREQSGLSVQVQKDDILGERLVTSHGPVSSLAVVARMIFDAIARSSAP